MITPVLLHAAILGIATFEFLGLALCIEVHAEQVPGRVPRRTIRRWAGLVGCLGLVADLVVSVSGFGRDLDPVWAPGQSRRSDCPYRFSPMWLWPIARHCMLKGQ